MGYLIKPACCSVAAAIVTPERPVPGIIPRNSCVNGITSASSARQVLALPKRYRQHCQKGETEGAATCDVAMFEFDRALRGSASQLGRLRVMDLPRHRQFLQLAVWSSVATSVASALALAEGIIRSRRAGIALATEYGKDTPRAANAVGKIDDKTRRSRFEPYLLETFGAGSVACVLVVIDGNRCNAYCRKR